MYDFHDLYTSLSVTFVMYFNRRNKDILFISSVSSFIINSCSVFVGHRLRST